MIELDKHSIQNLFGLIARADLLVCDLAAQSLHEGEFQTAFAAGQIKKEDLVALGHILSDAHPGRCDDQAITIADLTSLAALDAAAALTVLHAARPRFASKEKS